MSDCGIVHLSNDSVREFHKQTYRDIRAIHIKVLASTATKDRDQKYVLEDEQNPQNYSKRKRDSHIFPGKLPEFDNPISASSRSVRPGCGQSHAFLCRITVEPSPVC
jgi:hypothetical protein